MCKQASEIHITIRSRCPECKAMNISHVPEAKDGYEELKMCYWCSELFKIKVDNGRN